MYGHLPLIGLKPIQRPEYSSTRGISRDDWLRANDEAIREWYVATSEAVPEEHPYDYEQFALCQYDVAVDLDERFTDGLYEAELRESDSDDTPWDDPS